MLKVKNIRRDDNYVFPRQHHVVFDDDSAIAPEGYIMKKVLADKVRSMVVRRNKNGGGQTRLFED